MSSSINFMWNKTNIIMQIEVTRLAIMIMKFVYVNAIEKKKVKTDNIFCVTKKPTAVQNVTKASCLPFRFWINMLVCDRKWYPLKKP